MVVEKNKRLVGKERMTEGARLAKQYAKGNSIREIATATGHSIGRVRVLLLEAGVELRARGGRSGKRKTAS